MIVLWPLLLVGAAVVMGKARARPHRFRGWAVAFAWAIAGALFAFSLATGYSVGLFIFPAAAVAALWLASNAPGREAIAFPVGAAVVVGVLVLAF